MSSQRQSTRRQKAAVVSKASAKPVRQQQARLIIDANCTTCGLIDNLSDDPFAVQDAAVQHATETGHIVILNGTADLPAAYLFDAAGDTQERVAKC